MGIFRAVARPVLFALDPETAHGVVTAALGLPLPWEIIGAVPDDPRLEVRFAGLPLRNPIGLAAGFDKSCRHLEALGRLGFGYVVGGTVTRAPRAGNSRPRIVRYPRRRSMVNAMGLPNPGVEEAADRLATSRRTAPRIASIADEAVDDVVAAHERLEPLVDGVELNVSCPNVSWGRDRDNEAHVAALLHALRGLRSTPLFVKLPPFRAPAERDAVLALAGIAIDAGVQALTCSNTRPVGEPRLPAGSGGLSGAALAPDTPRIVDDVSRATRGAIAISACGGISTAEQARACLDAGATTIQVYTGLVYEGPRLIADILAGLLGVEQHASSAVPAAEATIAAAHAWGRG
jgi:dihydroorotate dehydrogenase